jgi:hypothetical protein
MQKVTRGGIRVNAGAAFALYIASNYGKRRHLWVQSALQSAGRPLFSLCQTC